MKTIALYGLQALVGLVAVATGSAKLAGLDFMAQPFAMIGLGEGFLMTAGAVEVLAGVCLLFPRAGVVGAVLLTSVVLGTVGASLGAAISHKAEPAAFTVSQTRTFMRPAADDMARPAIRVNRHGWDI